MNYEELVKDLREKVEFLDKTSYDRNVHNSFAVAMNNAADAIEELQADLNNALNSVENLINEADKRRWIPVTEKQDGKV